MKIIQIFALICYLFFTLKETLAVQFSQKDYHIINDRMVVEKQNEDWVHVNVINGLFNRTHRIFSINFVLHKDPHPSNIIVKIQAYRFTSNVYKLFAPLKLSVNGCDVLEKNSFGLRAWATTNGNITDCPIKKGRMSVWNWVPEEEKFPPYVPEGKYRIALEFITGTTPMSWLSWYGSIVKRKQF